VTSSGRMSGLLWEFATYMQSMGYCQELGIGIAILGILIAYPSVRLFWEANRVK
jgi:uncharacterized membrane protein (UPF0136 family)